MAEYTFSFCCSLWRSVSGSVHRESRGEFSVLRCGDIFYFSTALVGLWRDELGKGMASQRVSCWVTLHGEANWSLTYRLRDRDDGRC